MIDKQTGRANQGAGCGVWVSGASVGVPATALLLFSGVLLQGINQMFDRWKAMTLKMY